MSTDKRDKVVRTLAQGKAFFYRKNDPKYQAEAEQLMDGAIAEALRNAAERLDGLASDRNGIGASHDVPGLLWGANTLREDAAALENANTTERTED